MEKSLDNISIDPNDLEALIDESSDQSKEIKTVD